MKRVMSLRAATSSFFREMIAFGYIFWTFVFGAFCLYLLFGGSL